MTECLKVTKEQRAYDQQSVKYTKEWSVTYFTGVGNVLLRGGEPNNYCEM